MILPAFERAMQGVNICGKVYLNVNIKSSV